jgi:hypothetical protein
MPEPIERLATVEARITAHETFDQSMHSDSSAKIERLRDDMVNLRLLFRELQTTVMLYSGIGAIFGGILASIAIALIQKFLGI